MRRYSRGQKKLKSNNLLEDEYVKNLASLTLKSNEDKVSKI